MHCKSNGNETAVEGAVYDSVGELCGRLVLVSVAMSPGELTLSQENTAFKSIKSRRHGCLQFTRVDVQYK